MTCDWPPPDAVVPPAEPVLRAWIVLESVDDAQAWVDRLDREMQQMGKVAADKGCGICLTLAQGGRLVLHTNSDGDVLLDVEDEAAWIAPLVSAATGVQAPRGSIWLIPGHRLVELVLGLNSLVESEKLVIGSFRKRW